jgi:5-methylcytosine-specific restriction protein A
LIDGTPYLETHHTTRLADEGLDHPQTVGAICPTCHRRIHSGIDGDAWNKQLKQRLLKKAR